MLDQAQPIPAETPIQLTLPVAQVNTLLAALCEAPLPHRVSDPIIRAIRVQVQPQVIAAAAPKPAETGPAPASAPRPADWVERAMAVAPAQG